MITPSPLAETLTFLHAHLPPLPGPLLEVGCGKGALAAMLEVEGYQITAIDRDPEAIAAARVRGVNAECVDFEDFSGGPFTALLFTHSLHHIHPLAETLDRAHGMLRPGGLLICEEFAHEDADEPTAAWFFERWDAALTAGGKSSHKHDPASEGKIHKHDPGPGALPLARWRGRLAHDPPLHEGLALRAGIAACYKLELTEAAPYLYRYFTKDFAGVDWTERILTEERTALSTGTIKPIGLRLVGRRGG